MPTNYIDTKAIEAFLEDTADGDQQIALWLKTALLSSLKKREQSAVPLTELPADAPDWVKNRQDITGIHQFVADPELIDKVRHIRDWLVSARTQDEPFLKDVVEGTDRPKTLANTNLEGACNAADKYFKRLNQTFRAVVEDDSDTKTVMRFPDGSRIVQLLTTDALKYEGPRMGHCIGGGAYDEYLLDGSCVFYSLRDVKNEPHATFHVEVAGNVLHQCQGKENKPPVKKYMPYVQQFVMQQRFELRESPSHTGLVKAGRQYLDIFNLPDGITINDNLNLSQCGALQHLPDNLSVEGYLALWGCTGLTRLPNNLCVSEGIDAGGCTGLTQLPDSLPTNCWLNFSGCTGLTQLPHTFSVVNHMNLSRCTNLMQLPDTFTVRGFLNLSECTGLTQLPDFLSVDDNLLLVGCTGLTQLPDGLSVGGCLNLIGCEGITSIPRSIYVGRAIYTDIGTFNSVDAAADAFEKRFGVPNPRPGKPKPGQFSVS